MSDSPTTAPARNAPRANDTPKTADETIGDAQGDGQHGQREQLARALAGDLVEQPGHDPGAGHEHQRREDRRLAEGQGELAERSEARSRRGRRPSRRASGAMRRQQDEHDDREQVLDDEPADRDAALGRVEVAAVHERPEQDHGAGDRDGQAEDEPATDAPAEGQPETRRRASVATRIWPMAPGDGDGPHGQQVADREVDADPEHQQDHAELGQLGGDGLVGDEARRERADEHARGDVADDRRQVQPPRDERADERGASGRWRWW